MSSAVQQSTYLNRHANGMMLSPEEFDAIHRYDRNYRYELINGVVIVSPVQSEAQSDPNDELGHLLRVYRETHPQGGVLDRTMPERYVRVENGRRLADRVIWAGLGHRPNPAKDVPTIVVEFVSKGQRSRNRDYVDKRREYLTAGVKEYWVIDRFRRTVTVFRADEPDLIIPENKNYETPLLPGFVLLVAHVLAVADDWAK